MQPCSAVMAAADSDSRDEVAGHGEAAGLGEVAGAAEVAVAVAVAYDQD